jgi:hypothetical protein
MKSETQTLQAFAGLRFMGDRLEPDKLTAILGVAPTTAYRKGEVYKRSRGHEVRGRTGLWLLSSKGFAPVTDLDNHLRYLLSILFPGGCDDKLGMLRDLMREEQLKADVGCFWYGKSGAAFPVIPEELRAAFARLPADIETDFHTD